MKTIWKFPMSPADEVSIPMPACAKVLSAAMQGEVLCLWAEVEPSQPKASKRFYVVGTGAPFPPEPVRFINTVQMMGGTLIFHIYEVV